MYVIIKLIISTLQITNFVDSKMKAGILHNSSHIKLAYNVHLLSYPPYMLVLLRSRIKTIKSKRGFLKSQKIPRFWPG